MCIRDRCIIDLFSLFQGFIETLLNGGNSASIFLAILQAFRNLDHCAQNFFIYNCELEIQQNGPIGHIKRVRVLFRAIQYEGLSIQSVSYTHLDVYKRQQAARANDEHFERRRTCLE